MSVWIAGGDDRSRLGGVCLRPAARSPGNHRGAGERDDPQPPVPGAARRWSPWSASSSRWPPGASSSSRTRSSRRCSPTSRTPSATRTAPRSGGRCRCWRSADWSPPWRSSGSPATAGTFPRRVWPRAALPRARRPSGDHARGDRHDRARTGARPGGAADRARLRPGGVRDPLRPQGRAGSGRDDRRRGGQLRGRVVRVFVAADRGRDPDRGDGHRRSAACVSSCCRGCSPRGSVR